jgi:hypothetical protein
MMHSSFDFATGVATGPRNSISLRSGGSRLLVAQVTLLSSLATIHGQARRRSLLISGCFGPRSWPSST